MEANKVDQLVYAYAEPIDPSWVDAMCREMFASSNFNRDIRSHRQGYGQASTLDGTPAFSHQASAEKLRPDLDTRSWRSSEIRIVYGDGKTPLSKEAWSLIESVIMAVHEKVLDHLIKSGYQFVENLAIRNKYYFKSLMCGVINLQHSEETEFFRDILVHSLRSRPQLQFVIKSDPRDLMITVSVPSYLRAYSANNYVKFLVAMNPVLRNNQFELVRVNETDCEEVFLFKTCRVVVDHISKANYFLPHMYGKTRFNRHFTRLSSIGITRLLQDEESTPPPDNAIDQSVAMITPSLGRPCPALRIRINFNDVLKPTPQEAPPKPLHPKIRTTTSQGLPALPSGSDNSPNIDPPGKRKHSTSKAQKSTPPPKKRSPGNPIVASNENLAPTPPRVATDSPSDGPTAALDPSMTVPQPTASSSSGLSQEQLIWIVRSPVLFAKDMPKRHSS